MTWVCGIDSSTKTGIVVAHAQDNVPVLKHTSLIRVDEAEGLTRAGQIAQAVLDVMGLYPVGLVVIEGYGLANKFSLATLVEIGTVTRYFVKQSGYKLLTVAPATLKKFVLGKGAGQKNMMLKEAHKRWGFDIDDDNINDAACLAVMGLAYANQYKPPTKAMLEAVGMMKLCS